VSQNQYSRGVDTRVAPHLIQHPPFSFRWPSGPVWLYRWNRGLHVFSGLAAIPVLGAKLWPVYPKLHRWPPSAISAPGAGPSASGLRRSSRLYCSRY